MAREIWMPMEPEPGAPHRVAFSIVPVRIRRERGLGRVYNALVDTGSAFTVASMTVARHFWADPNAVTDAPA